MNTIGMNFRRESEKFLPERFGIDPWPAGFVKKRKKIGHLLPRRLRR